MITMNPLELDGMLYTAIKVELPKTNLLMITNDYGYIMCGALDVDVLNRALKDRHVIAGRAVGVKTIADLLEAPLDKVTDAAALNYDWKPGLTGREALLKIS